MRRPYRFSRGERVVEVIGVEVTRDTAEQRQVGVGERTAVGETPARLHLSERSLNLLLEFVGAPAMYLLLRLWPNFFIQSVQ